MTQCQRVKRCYSQAAIRARTRRYFPPGSGDLHQGCTGRWRRGMWVPRELNGPEVPEQCRVGPAEGADLLRAAGGTGHAGRYAAGEAVQ